MKYFDKFMFFLFFQGKLTLIVIHCLKVATKDDSARLLSILEMKPTD